MANDSQYKIASRIVATRGVREYRATIEALVTAQDTVLEIGCEWGTTTKLLTERAGQVLGTDISAVCIERGLAEHPNLDLRVLDAFDLNAVLRLDLRITKVYMDLSGLSGYRGLLDLIALINNYSTLLQPDTIVVKSGALKHFAQLCQPWPEQR
ncbi:class I SAM-dependent methyltransferase [Microlunatus sp. GCM10028923]|uniref:class I SAM-dependent methyltransferase n=1 Tax=Microlunatus sp. GCM10028923 TaxID=3273400 RepID=UPI00361E0B7F